MLKLHMLGKKKKKEKEFWSENKDVEVLFELFYALLPNFLPLPHSLPPKEKAPNKKNNKKRN